MPDAITIVIADDHPIFRSGVRQAIEKDSSLRIIGEAGDGKEALRIIQERSPHVAVLDIRMPLMTGLSVAKELFRSQSNVLVVHLTMYDEEEWFETAMDAGVKGYVLKDCASSDIVQAIHAVVEGKYYISAQLSNKGVHRKEETTQPGKVNPHIDELTERERDLLRMIGDGKSSKEIGDALFISPRTVDNHRTNIARKLGLQGSFSLLKFALENRSVL